MESAQLYLERAIVALKVGLGLNTKAESALLIFALTQSNIGHLKLKQNQPDAIAPLEESLLVRALHFILYASPFFCFALKVVIYICDCGI